MGPGVVTPRRALAFAALAILSLGGCTKPAPIADGSVGDGSAGTDLPRPGDGSAAGIPCGKVRCQGNEFCVVPCCTRDWDGGYIPCDTQPPPFCLAYPAQCGNRSLCECGVVLAIDCGYHCAQVAPGIYLECPCGI